MKIWWVPSLWHSVTLPLKNPDYDPVLSYLHLFIQSIQFIHFRTAYHCRATSLVHKTYLAMWVNLVISSETKENKTQNEQVVFQCTLMIYWWLHRQGTTGLIQIWETDCSSTRNGGTGTLHETTIWSHFMNTTDAWKSKKCLCRLLTPYHETTIRDQKVVTPIFYTTL